MAKVSQLDDQQIRSALKERLLQRGVPLIVEEFELLNGQTRVDLFVYDRFFTGIEIKSDCDTLARLPGQIEIYNRYFEKIEIVVGARYLDRVRNLVPKWWGITSVGRSKGTIRFKSLRLPKANPLFRPDALLEFLWRDEVLELLALYGHSKGTKSQDRFLLRSSAKNFISHEELRFFVFDFMKKRLNWRSVPTQKQDDD